VTLYRRQSTVERSFGSDAPDAQSIEHTHPTRVLSRRRRKPSIVRWRPILGEINDPARGEA